MKIQLLDHGYIELVDRWGSDERIIEEARQSTDKGFLGWEPRHADDCLLAGTVKLVLCDCITKKGDEGLLNHLWTNKHTSPFEFGGVTVHVQAPLAVIREWHRHRTQSYSELSARYTKMPSLQYMPSVNRCMMVLQQSGNKQATSGSGAILNEQNVLLGLAKLEELYEHSEEVYKFLLELGFAKEIARLSVLVARYSRMGASANLLNWLKFVTLRDESAAQYEIRVYAEALGKILEREFPRTLEIYYRKREEGQNVERYIKAIIGETTRLRLERDDYKVRLQLLSERVNGVTF